MQRPLISDEHTGRSNSVTERIQLIKEILDSLPDSLVDAAEAAPLSDAQRQELDRRLALLEANPSAVRNWEEVEASVLARLHR